MYHDLKAFLKVCHECQVCDKAEEKSLSAWAITVNYIFQRYELDYIGLLTETESEKVYLLVITKYYTRFPFTFAVKNANTETTTKILYNNIFCLFEPFTEILTD